MAAAFGQMGMNPADFWQMSWRDFQIKQRGFFELKNQEYKRTWEQTRLLAFYAIKPHDVHRRFPTAKDLFMFRWEKPIYPELTPEIIDYWERKMGKTLTN